jgi:hypothetical protein
MPKLRILKRSIKVVFKVFIAVQLNDVTSHGLKGV